MHDDLRSRVAADFPRTRAELESLVRIPSVSAPGFDAGEVRRSALATAQLMREAGLDDVRLLEVEGGHPAVLGRRHVGDDRPTVLLYAHHDVQPPGEAAQWTSDPFQPAERGGRLFGRGISDDKAGIAVHLAALRALGDGLPVNVKMFVEGEEEIGSLHLTDFLTRYATDLAADVIVIADSANWRVGEPALTTTLRGLVDCEVEVRTLRDGVHSGLFGGAFPDALMALSRVLASLHDEAGRPAVAGLVSGGSDGPDLDAGELREQAGAAPETRLIGEGSLTSRTWSQPAISILAIDAPPVAGAINQLVPVARAKVSVRLAPGDDPPRAMAVLVAHLEAQRPWGAAVSVTPGASAAPVALDAAGPAYDAFRHGFAEAWGRPAVDIGVGGSIPFVGAFQAAAPGATILLTGAGDPTSHIHGPNESQDLGDLRRACLAEAIALRALGAG
jgi:acetylornithine deacetylase/succinyl-diaminopimelate desuccinylase-like protein